MPRSDDGEGVNAAGDHNQAMMELGATLCLPRRLRSALQCPVYSMCKTRGEHVTPVACSAAESAGGVSAESAEAGDGDGGAAGAAGRGCQPDGGDVGASAVAAGGGAGARAAAAGASLDYEYELLRAGVRGAECAGPVADEIARGTGGDAGMGSNDAAGKATADGVGAEGAAAAGCDGGAAGGVGSTGCDRVSGGRGFMNAAVVSSYDAAPRFGSFEEPVAGEGEVLVNVSAAGLHPIVKSLANGSHYGSTGVLPFVPGVDGVGRLADGRRVFFGAVRSPFGTFAERTVASGKMCLELPEGLEDAVAAGLANPAMSSWAALKARAKFVAGESVLVLGATGVAGQLGGADCQAAGCEEG